MKKLISLMLAVLMIALCACGFAEGTDVSAKTAFVQIKELKSRAIKRRLIPSQAARSADCSVRKPRKRVSPGSICSI